MAKNYVHSGRRLVFTAPSGGVVSGQVVTIGAVFGVALTSAAVGAQFTMEVGGVWILAKATGAIGEGVSVYWDNTAKNVTTTVGSNQKLGVAEAAALSSDTTMTVRLNSNF